MKSTLILICFTLSLSTLLHAQSNSTDAELKKKIEELERKNKEAERRAAEAEKKVQELEKKSTQTITQPSAPATTKSATPKTGDDVKYVKTPDGKTVKMVNGKIVPDATNGGTSATTQETKPQSAVTGDVKYVKGPDGKMLKMVNGKIVNETTETPTAPTTKSESGDVKYVKGPDGKMLKMVNGKIVKDEAVPAVEKQNSPNPTDVQIVKSPDGKKLNLVNGKPATPEELKAAEESGKNKNQVSTVPPKPFAPDIGKVTRMPNDNTQKEGSKSGSTSTQEQPSAPPIVQRKVDTSRPSIMNINADSDCIVKINGKEIPPIKAGTPVTYKAHWGENTIDAFLQDRSDKISEKIFIDADKFTYAIRFVKPEKLLKFITENKVEAVQQIVQNDPQVLNPKDEFEFSPLALASEKGKTDIVKFMLDKGADVKLPGNSQSLLNAAMNGHTEIARMLIEKGMDVNQKFENGWTLLHHATQKGKMEVITLLLEKGVDVSIKNDQGNTAKDLAYENGMLDLAKMLSK